MLSSQILTLADVICHSIRCFQNILVVFSIYATESFILKSVYLGGKLLLRMMVHCLSFLIVIFFET